MGEQKQPQDKGASSVRLRRAALFVLFTAVLLIPKALGLRRRRVLWNGLRLGAAIVGAVFMGTLRGGELGWLGLVTGLLLVLLALLVRPATQSKSVDEQARELDALVVLNGGRFTGADGKPAEARLFVAPQHLYVLDPRQRPLLEIPLDAISSVRVEEATETDQAKEANEGWQLVIEWNQEVASFHYVGFFAEHLARVAETTLRSQLHRELPVLR